MPRGARLAVAALLGALAVSGAAAAAESAPSAQRTLRVTHGTVSREALRPGQGAASVRRYWTPRRMRSAIPVAPAEAKPTPLPLVSSATTGRPSRVPAAVAVPFDRYEVPDTIASPARTHGRVFFTMGGSDYACSGTVVNSPDESVVFSAGHCVDDPGGEGWATNWAFVPGYRLGNAPFGEFVATELSAPGGWIDFGYFSYDIGAAVVGSNAAGQTLQDSLGGVARGIAFNQSRDQHFQSWGYPADIPFDGERLYVCESAYAGEDPHPDPSGPHGISIGCDMTAGSSGGGWIIGGKYLNSVNSFGYDALPNVMFGPYFGDAAKMLYDRVCCKDSGVSPNPNPPPASGEAPQTTFTAHPSHRTRSHRAFFAFRSSLDGSTFECLYSGGWSNCRSPQRFGGLLAGYRYLFKVRAVKDGVKDPTPAVWSFRVRR